MIGLDENNQVKYWYWPKDEEIVIDQEVLDRIHDYLKDSLLLCEYHHGAIYVWGAVDTVNKVVVSMLATEMAAEVLQIHAMEHAQKRGPRRVVTTPIELAGLGKLITRPEEAFPLSDLGEKVIIQHLIEGNLEIIPMELPPEP